jgi:hypothetical protein
VEDFSRFEKVLIKSHAKLLLSDGIHDDRVSDNENSVATVAYSRISAKIEKQIPLWIYLMSVFLGLFILLLCVIGFYMVRDF